MGFLSRYERCAALDPGAVMQTIGSREAERAVDSASLSDRDLLALLSPAAGPLLETMAQRSHVLTAAHFGRTMQLYTPLYLSNYCENACRYCGFSARNGGGSKLSVDEVKREAAHIAATGLRHVLVLTGSSRRETPVSYIRRCVEVLAGYFSSIAVEVYAMDRDEYGELVGAGVDGLTIYQETYDQRVYREVHPAGPKRDYRYRLHAPERGAEAGMRRVNIGALLGLGDWRTDAYYTAMHARYLQDTWPALEVSVSIPRLRPHGGTYLPAADVDVRALVQIITAVRIFLPRVGITLSTREDAATRENLLPLGITRLSAGSTTRVGGHTRRDGSTPQFSIADERSVDAVIRMLKHKGYQPVLKDWMSLG